MNVLTDSPEFAVKLLGPLTAAGDSSAGVRALADKLLLKEPLCLRAAGFHPLWKYLLITERSPRSQYDDLIKIVRERPNLAGGILCLAGTGSGFHGNGARPWVCGRGNLHLCAFLAPGPGAPRPAAAYMVLAVVSVLQTLDSPGLAGAAAVKWVNDIVIDGAKVGGALVHTQNLGADVTGVVLGIGLNVETAPEIGRDCFVPRAGCLREFAKEKPACAPGPVFRRLSAVLADNYEKLLAGGRWELHEIYAERSAALGRRVSVYEGDIEVRSGRAAAVGDNLELFLEGEARPVAGGRLLIQ